MALETKEKRKVYIQVMKEWEEWVKFSKKFLMYSGGMTIISRLAGVWPITLAAGMVTILGMGYHVYALKQINKCITCLSILDDFDNLPTWASMLKKLNEVEDVLHKEKK